MALPEYENLARQKADRPSAAARNLATVEEDGASVEVAALYNDFRARFGRPDPPGILKCFATHPALLRGMMDISESLIFAEGHLTRRHKEMIATLVSAQNECDYCADSHGYFLTLNGGSSEVLHAVQNCELTSQALTDAERALLLFAAKITHESQLVDRLDVEELLGKGWNEAQIAEAIHVTALFAAFNRVVNAFGLPSQGLLALYSGNDSETQTG